MYFSFKCQIKDSVLEGKTLYLINFNVKKNLYEKHQKI